jgi:hypothetical protein
MTRCAPHELDSVNEGHVSPSPPVAPAGSDSPSIANATMPTGNRSLIRMHIQYRSQLVTCTDCDDRQVRCMGTFHPMIQNQNAPCGASPSTIWPTADRHFVRRHVRRCDRRAQDVFV